MKDCFVDFKVYGESALLRTIECVDLVATLKRHDALDEEHLSAAFSSVEKACFWQPTPDEMREWSAFWFPKPIAERHSPAMPTSGWDYGSMIESIADVELDIKGVVREHARAYLTFEPFSYPFGGTGSRKSAALMQVVAPFR